MKQLDFSRMLEVAIVAARLAGQRALEEQRYTHTEVKNGSELVTHADAICQEIAMNRIMETYPNHGFLAEEGPDSKMLKYPPRSGDPIWWIIDPIDGTNNYAHGILNYTVSIAAMYEGRPIVGVIFEPATEAMYTASVGSEAQLNASKITANQDGISEFASFGIDTHFTPRMEKPMLEMMRNTRYRNFGTTALHLAYVARGGLIGMVATRPRLWDFAAGALIVERAGAKFSDINGNEIFPLDVSEYDGRGYQLLAANAKIFNDIVTLFNS